MFSPDPLDVTQNLPVDRALRPLPDPVDDINQKFNEDIGDLLFPLRAVGGKKRVADRSWVTADLA